MAGWKVAIFQFLEVDSRARDGFDEEQHEEINCSIFFSTGGLLHFCEQSRTKHNAVKHTSMTLLSWQFRAQ